MPESNITKSALASEMKQLMQDKPFAKISISEICSACGMNRKSFYYHFKDKYDLVNWIFQTEFIDTISVKDYQNSWQFLEDIVYYFYKERAFYKRALEIRGQNSFRTYFTEVIEPFLLAFHGDVFQDVDNKAFYITFFSDAFLAAIIRWLSEGASMTPDIFLSQLEHILFDFAKRVIVDLDSKVKE